MAIIKGTPGNDTLQGTNKDTVFGGNGNDNIYIHDGYCSVDAGAGNDLIRPSFYNNDHSYTVTGGSGQDTYQLDDALNYDALLTITDFTTGKNGDVLDVSELYDGSYANHGYSSGNAFGKLGYARLVQVGADVLFQWDEDGVKGKEYSWQTAIKMWDTTVNSFTADNFLPATAPDGSPQHAVVLKGTANNDILHGTTVNDRLFGLAGDDTLYGFGGNDRLNGGKGWNTLNGGSGDDTLIGGSGSRGVQLTGGAGNDVMFGSAGDDTISDDGIGNNLINAGAGDDQFYLFVSGDEKATNVDTITGGSGQDNYALYLYGDVQLVITDFNSGRGGDILDFEAVLNSYGYRNGNPWGNYVQLIQDGTDTLLQVDHDGAKRTDHTWQTFIQMKNVAASSLIADNLPLSTFAPIVSNNITTTPLPTDPVFTSGATASAAENTASGTPIYDATADGDTGVTYGLSGADVDYFSIDASNGTVSLAFLPDYEHPVDSGSNNVYDFTVRATNAAGHFTDQAVAMTVTDVAMMYVTEPPHGQVIDLGADYGKLILPVNVDGKWYYYWDRSGDGTSDDIQGTGYANTVDYTTHDELDALFEQDSSGAVEGGDGAAIVGADGNTDNTYRYATLNGVSVALPTLGSTVTINPSWNVTSVSGTTASADSANPTYDDLLAVWDAYNGTGTGTGVVHGTPVDWHDYDDYWSATPSASGHALVGFYTGYINDMRDGYGAYVVLQVL